jgi:hypothetical protein
MRGGWTIRPPWIAFAGANVLHRDSFERLAPKFGVPGQDDEGLNTLARFWHALPAWPDVVGGLSRLKPRYMIAPLSNGHVALLVSMYCPHPVGDGHSHLRTAAAVEERNERPLLAALFAVIIGWSIAGLIALA